MNFESMALIPNELFRQDFSTALDFCDWIYETTRSRTCCELEGCMVPWLP